MGMEHRRPHRHPPMTRTQDGRTALMLGPPPFSGVTIWPGMSRAGDRPHPGSARQQQRAGGAEPLGPVFTETREFGLWSNRPRNTVPRNRPASKEYSPTPHVPHPARTAASGDRHQHRVSQVPRGSDFRHRGRSLAQLAQSLRERDAPRASRFPAIFQSFFAVRYLAVIP